ncbi:sugar porter family MFS transporter [Echinicola jeungdonensis]|uniref:Sugar porter family MFS transporter n=1 Tax=Echinicola jeungdonensis TaxID=709343 RepID=A0ABV5J2M4_9BACT|nr:sugar porter family MFS transporter [Echinicola jeungdonensis]MDN3667949.1 sugar porter family MFS transporter [Echinicola jeungdonensis]
MNKVTLYYPLIVSLSGFLFGFDTVVISGANLPLKNLWGTSEWFHGFVIMSVALWGTVLGAIFGGIPCNRFGRKNTLFWIGVLFLISALGTALATDPYVFSFYRFIGGLAIGASSIAAPTYLSEISQNHHRGKTVILFQINIVIGILAAYTSNYFLQGFGGNNDWRWMLGAEVVPALIYLGLILNIPKSPRWLVLYQHKDEAAHKILKRLYSETEANHILTSIQKDQFESATMRLFSQQNQFALILAFLIAIFNQLSGINFILYYAPEIIEKAGFITKESLLGTVFIGFTNLVCTLLGMYLIDLVGRKQLMLIGSLGYIFSLSLISFGFYTDINPMYKLMSILLFIASHGIGQGAVIWVFISEIFPTKVRALGQSFGSGVHWSMAALITLFGAVLIENLAPWQIFMIFNGFMVLQLLFVIFIMPETKGLSLEKLQKRWHVDKPIKN